ncbi:MULTISPECIES: GNAT family N-acetyltransferase [Streptomyces]|uniref:Acetyltransferase n=1 Tax=Streptomyces sviceus (strain ATCC 29083 / DSM 924 / JCM 4929 / NBRC 13980 / NCIMB 11184 / NRRL 5439 / UC 5370) TaxID=463191 RepID=B5I2R7_STRX2|nr:MULTISPECIES: GNAT family N-acetyltransferase [Streptomyces]EDY59372.1 acetyltransferase [Streptomyces sviceus ATCC 29083]MYT05495.1 GNAT family N-acetyltransferase [Streptomyces sp. SID5470]
MTWTITAEHPASPTAAALWRAYYTEVSDRYYLLHENRRTDPAELEREVAKETRSDLTPPTGQLLVARYAGEPAGTAGIRLRPDGSAELTRVYVREELRGKGGAPLLVAAAESAARALGATRLVLETRKDLTEALTLYARLGYKEIAPYSDDIYADHTLGKPL